MIEAVVRFILEVLGGTVLYGIAYWTGWVLLMVFSAGQLRLGGYDSWELSALNARELFSIWRRGENGVRELKAEIVCALGVVFWLMSIIGMAVYFSSVF